MEDGLVQSVTLHKRTAISVLILVVMEDGLVHGMTEVIVTDDGGLNPCCNGRWSRT